MAINLLPLKQKRFARSVYRTHRLVAVLIIFALILLGLLSLMVALNITIKQEKVNNAKALESLSGKGNVIEFNELRDEINLVAKHLVVIRNNTDPTFLTTDLFSQIISSKPQGISLNNFEHNIEAGGQEVKLSGVSGERQNLLDFSTNLESLPWVDFVDSPVTNLVGDKDFNFSVSISIKETKND